jgi:hypothetical protein
MLCDLCYYWTVKFSDLYNSELLFKHDAFFWMFYSKLTVEWSQLKFFIGDLIMFNCY